MADFLLVKLSLFARILLVLLIGPVIGVFEPDYQPYHYCHHIIAIIIIFIAMVIIIGVVIVMRYADK